MGDSAAALWESELLRARQWLAARRRDEQQEREQLFQRVKAHIGFKDHQRSLQSDAVASEDEDDALALDFLGDVDASDMSALLQAEAAKAAASVPPVEVGPPLETRMPNAAELMQPLAMPSNLASPTLKPKVKAVPMSQLDPKTVRTATSTATTATTTATGSATLGSDAAVHELMQNLQVDVIQLQQSDEETKTEESTPPHLLKEFGGNSKVTSGGAPHAAGSTQSKFMQQVSLKSPQDPHKKKVAAPASTTTTTTMTDDVAAEMLSWVSGYRDPEVIRRKENMRRRRKHTNRFGMSSEEEQREALRRAKQITNSDSESEDDFSSDYSPAEEEEEIPEPDEPEVVDLLSDDYLDSDEGTKPVKRKRKRLRQAASSEKKKKPRSRKPAVTRKLSQQDSTTKEAPLPAEKLPVQAPVGPIASEVYHTVATTKSVSSKVSDEDASGNSNHPIEVLSSEDETNDSDKSSASTTVNGTAEKVVDADATKESTIVRLKIPVDFQGPQAVQGVSHNTQETRTADADVNKVFAEVHGSAAVAPPGSLSHQTTAGRQTARGEEQLDKEEATRQLVDSNDGDADLSDTGTLDLEAEDLSLGNEDSNPGEEAASLEVKAGNDAGRARKETVECVDAALKNADTKTGVEVGEIEDEDVSEAETEILEDDEPDTDDLGLEYSDDSDADDKPAASKKNGTGGETKASSDEKGEAAPTQKTPEAGDSGKSVNGKSGDKAVDSSTAGVQQFFDFTPLKLKTKVKATTTTAPKPLPVHDCTETHAKKASNDVKKATVEPKLTPSPDKPSVGSNGLRPSKKPIATSTVMKGKFAVTRRSTKMLDPEDTPGAKRPQKSHYTMVPTKKTNGSDAAKDLDDVPLTLLARELSKKTEEKSNARYLAYAGAKKTEDAPSYAVETTRNVPKSRFGGGSESTSTTHNSGAANGQPAQVNDKTVSQGGYRREPQISIYDALHVDGQESASDIREGTGYKRPSRFKKMQEEAARNGTPMVKSRLQNTDLDKLPIPKKKKHIPAVEKPQQDTPPKASRTNDCASRNAPGNTQNKRRKKSSGSFNKNSGPSYYGPQSSTTPDKYEAPTRGHRGRENGSYRRDDDRRRKRSPSPPSRDRDRYSRDGKFRDDRKRRGSSRSRSRSPSPRGRDYGSSRHRRRSRSRSWSRERPSEHDYRRTERAVSSSRDRERDPRVKRRSPSPDKRDSSKKKSVEKTSNLPELGEVCQNGKVDEDDWVAKKQKLSPREDAPPSPGALATFDDDGDMFISDSDDDGNAFVKEVEDIRFDLDDVPVDEDLMVRQVYVTGVNPTVCAEQIEEDFARFGVAIDRDTGFPAIAVFPSQRTHLGRGDACVTFETKEGAQEAVEELNSKNVKNSMIHVRRMDIHTQRILTVQFETVRDTWKCAGTQCRAEVSVWNPKCDKCGRKRVFGPSNIKIGAESWLCSICFTANDSFATSCHGCSEALPEVDRSAFYTS